MQREEILKQLSLEEKVALVSGRDFFYTNSVKRLNIPSVSLADGPHGLRKQIENEEIGLNKSEPSTAFPTAVCTASGWNDDNLYKMGQAIAKECLYYGVNNLLGPGVNIKRNPLCGRNFEYFSEDPYLAGRLATAQINGVQSQGVGATIKHFALNNSENYRNTSSSYCDNRAMSEIYLKPFEMAVKNARPHSVMCAYNAINGTYASENEWLFKDILRDLWGFSGLVMTDWGATVDRIKSIKAGCDLEMPGDTPYCRKQLFDGVKSGKLDEKELDECVLRIIDFAKGYENNKQIEVDFESHDKLAGEIAEDCAVLMKNDGVLPLNHSEKVCVVGHLFEKMRYQGSGSSMINCTKITTPKDAFDTNGVNYHYAQGYKENSFEGDEKLLQEAVRLMQDCDKILLFIGLTDYAESEGCDRDSMQLPKNQLEVINLALKAKKPVAIVFFGGSPVEMPFKNEVNAILNMYLPGQNGGSATYNLLFGLKNPCGKLAETWAENYSDTPFYNEYSKGNSEIYKESVFVGYRYYSTVNRQVAFPFGFGLSYTTFEYSSLNLSQTDSQITLSFNIKNTGKYDGAEIAELFVKAPIGPLFRPKKELKGYKKVYLKAGEQKEVSITLNREDLAIFNPKTNSWQVLQGEYIAEVCSNVNSVQLLHSFDIDGESVNECYSKEIYDIYSACDFEKVNDEIFEQMSGIKLPKNEKSLPITMLSRFSDLKQTFFGRILYFAVTGIARSKRKQALRLPEGQERDNKIKSADFLLRTFNSNSLTSLTMAGGNMFPYNLALGVMHISNGKIFKGLKCILTPIKAPKLPD